MKGCMLPFLKKDNLRITKNYRGKTFTTIPTKVYNALLLNLFNLRSKNSYKISEQFSEKSFHKFIDSKYQLNHLKATLLFIDFS